MAIIKISELPAADTPLSASDVVPALQNGVTKKAAIDQFGFLPSGTNAVTRTLQAKLRETVSITDFGADPTGVADSYGAFVAALAASDAVFVPAGTFKVGTQIDITGNKVIYGLGGDNFEALPSRINHTAASGNLFSATSAEFGGIVIRNLSIIGGNGGYAIRSSRPQSVFENILMEVYNGSGIQLFEAGTGSQASWATVVKDVKWVGPASQTAYRGFDITQNGGLITLYRCTAIRGSIGININQGEAIDIVSCSFNLQTSTTSSLSADNQCCIRLSGGGYKKAVSIRNSYIEAYTYGIYVEKCESLSIENNYLADVGFSSNYSSIYLKDNNVNNVTIRNNNFGDNSDNHNCVEIGNGAANVYVLNNFINGAGINAVGIKKGTTTRSYVEANKFNMNVSTGTTIVDPNYLIVDLDFAVNGFLSYSRKDFTSVNDTWYDLGAVGNDQVWRITIMDSNTPGTWRLTKDLVISKTGVATFETIYSVDGGFAIRELRVSGGKIQFRTTGAAGNTANTITAMRLV